MDAMIFNAQIYDIRVRGEQGRIQLDFGADALHVMRELIGLGSLRGQNFQIAIVQVVPEPDVPPEPIDF